MTWKIFGTVAGAILAYVIATNAKGVYRYAKTSRK
jgi:hypothetical protein